MTWQILTLLAKGALITLQVSLISMVIGIFFGSIIGVLNSKRLKIPIISTLITAIVTVIRGTPLFIQLLIVYFALPGLTGLDMSPIAAGILTLGLNSSCYLAEIVRGGVNAIPLGQWEACTALGYTKVQSVNFIILPQVFKNVLPSITNELTTLIKESSILMVIGVPELTKVSKEIVARELKPLEIYLLAAGMYLVMTTLLTWITKKYEGGQNDSC